jgi:hypothetical protein
LGDQGKHRFEGFENALDGFQRTPRRTWHDEVGITSAEEFSLSSKGTAQTSFERLCSCSVSRRPNARTIGIYCVGAIPIFVNHAEQRESGADLLKAFYAACSHRVILRRFVATCNFSLAFSCRT